MDIADKITSDTMKSSSCVFPVVTRWLGHMRHCSVETLSLAKERGWRGILVALGSARVKTVDGVRVSYKLLSTIPYTGTDRLNTARCHFMSNPP